MLEIFEPESNFFKKSTVVIARTGPGEKKSFFSDLFCNKNSDVIIYDVLAGKSILNFANNTANLIFAGKKFANKSCTHKQIIDWLQQYSIKNKKR